MKREYWIDNIKLFACVLVAFGHFVQSMCQAGIVKEGAFLQWFEQTIYYFHVPLFFICSGYLYQARKKVNSWPQWKRHALEKLVALGIPYLSFSVVTWILKTVFSGSVNSQVNNLFYDLVIHPQSPYWYLFALFFISLLIPTFTSKKVAGVALCAAIVLRFLPGIHGIYVVYIILDNIIWFVGGILLNLFEFKSLAVGKTALGIVLAGIFLLISILTWYFAINSDVISFAMGILACCAVCIIFCHSSAKSHPATKYTMPIYLMHTIFAAGLRSVLLAMHIDNVIIHIVVGLFGSLLCPIVAIKVMQKIRLDFFVYPWRYMKKSHDRKQDGMPF